MPTNPATYNYYSITTKVFMHYLKVQPKKLSMPSSSRITTKVFMHYLKEAVPLACEGRNMYHNESIYALFESGLTIHFRILLLVSQRKYLCII